MPHDTLDTPPLQRQEGGSHYKDLAIQPVEYIHANGIGFMEGCAIKYLTRWRAKGGIGDLKKARHFIDLLIHLEAGEAPESPPLPQTTKPMPFVPPRQGNLQWKAGQ